MSPPMADYDHYAEPVRDAYDSEYTRQSFPSKYSNENEDGHRYTIPGQHYVSSESKSHTSSKHTRTTSSARRSRKSSSAARDLVKALLIEKLGAEDTSQAQLARAYATLRVESQRAVDAERVAIETAEKLKGISSSRAQALQDAARAQAELRAYKLQLENAQQQIRQANELVAQSDTERDRAVQAVARMKKAVEKYREGELKRRAIEQGRKEGREEALRDMGLRYSKLRERGPVVEDDDVPRTPSDATVLPIPPPEGVSIMSRRRAESMSQVQAPRTTTPLQPRPIRQNQFVQPQSSTNPQLLRRNTTTPTNDRSQSPWRPVPPPAMTPVRPPQSSTTPPVYSRIDNELENTLYERVRDPGRNRVGRGSPDQIIIRSPVPTHPAQILPQSQPQPQVQMQPPRPPSSHGSRPTHISYPTSQRPTRHHSIDAPQASAVLASESANRIYSQVSSSSDTDSFDRVMPPDPPEDIGYSAYSANREPLVMTPVPPPVNYYASSEPPRPVPPPNPTQNGHRRRQSVSSSSSASQRTDTASIKPSHVARFRNLFRRRDDSVSSSSSSTVPTIQIEPPSRPESVETMAATTGGHTLRELPHDPIVQRAHHSTTPIGRPPSRTGFMYGPAQSQVQAQPYAQPVAHVPHQMDYARGEPGFIPQYPSVQTPGATHGHRTPGMSFGEPPPVVGGANVAGLPRSGSAADYFSGQHRIPPSGGAAQVGRAERHRRGESDGTITDPNAYYDPETDPDWDEDEFGRPETPKASARTGFGYVPAGIGMPGGAGEYGGRPPSRGPSRGAEVGYEYVPPASAAALAASRRAEENRSTAGGVGGRNARVRRTSTADRSSGHVRSSTSTSRTPLGNTPFVRSSGLYEED